MSRFLPLKDINVTNVWPTESAPPGLNYYVAIDEIPYNFMSEWNSFLYKVHEITNGSFAGPRTSSLFGPEWRNLKNMTAMEQNRVQNLGYNPIFYKSGYGPVIWGTDVVGTLWNLSQLMTAVEIMTDLKYAIDQLLVEGQMSLFFPDATEVYRLRALIHDCVMQHRATRNLYCQDLNDSSCYMDNDSTQCTITVPIQPPMMLTPLMFNIKMLNASTDVAYWVSKESAPEYATMDHLFGIKGISLENA